MPVEGGRPGRRLDAPSYLAEMRSRYHRRIVSGVTSPAMPSSTWRRRRPALDGEAPALIIGQSKSPTTQLVAKNPVLLFQVVDDVELSPVDPAREEHQQKLKRLGCHERLILPCQNCRRSTLFAVNCAAQGIENTTDSRVYFGTGRGAQPAGPHPAGAVRAHSDGTATFRPMAASHVSDADALPAPLRIRRSRCCPGRPPAAGGARGRAARVPAARPPRRRRAPSHRASASAR